MSSINVYTKLALAFLRKHKELLYSENLDYLYEIASSGKDGLPANLVPAITEILTSAKIDPLMYLSNNVPKMFASRCKWLTKIDIPEGIVTIRPLGFSMCSNLTRVTLPSSLKNIDDYAFYNCVNINEIILPAGLRRIGYMSFASCDSLERVVYNGTVNQFRTDVIKMHNSFNKDCRILCSDDYIYFE